jgi:hypothetical protein
VICIERCDETGSRWLEHELRHPSRERWKHDTFHTIELFGSARVDTTSGQIRRPVCLGDFRSERTHARFAAARRSIGRTECKISRQENCGAGASFIVRGRNNASSGFTHDEQSSFGAVASHSAATGSKRSWRKRFGSNDRGFRTEFPGDGIDGAP